jgi:hypothetical protein
MRREGLIQTAELLAARAKALWLVSGRRSTVANPIGGFYMKVTNENFTLHFTLLRRFIFVSVFVGFVLCGWAGR